MKIILAVAYGGGHIACLLPVIQRLRAAADVQVEILALTTAAEVCVRHSLPYRGFKDFPAPADVQAQIQAHGQRVMALNPVHPAVSMEESIAYLGANYVDLEIAHGPVAAAALFAKQGRQAFFPLASMQRILAEVRPSVLLTTTAPRAEWAAVMAARAGGIPAVVVADLFGLAEAERLGDAAYGDVVCVLSEPVRAGVLAGVLAGEGVVRREPQSVHVTGNPVFDRLADPTLRARGQQLRAQRGWDSTQRIITWASQPEPSDPLLPRRIEAALMAAVAAEPTWHLVIRPHPSDVYALPPAGSQVSFSQRGEDLHTLLAASDAVVTMTSTVGLEAALLGIPLVTWDRSENTRDCPYAAMGISQGVSDWAQWPVALTQALAGQGPHPQ